MLATSDRAYRGQAIFNLLFYRIGADDLASTGVRPDEMRYIGMHGAVGQADEGIEAHLFQLLMPVQLVVMAYFALTWLPRSPGRALVVLALQVVATIAVLAAVYWVDHFPTG